ncbi:hypothetical protein GCM10027418_22380 [Mariniluteicoccus endophyticus]
MVVLLGSFATPAFKKFYPSDTDRLAALPGWIHTYNHHRPHSAIGKQPPIT